MPIKEYMKIALLTVGCWYVTGGQQTVHQNIHKLQWYILKDIGKTSNWGDPRPWHSRAPKIR